MVALRTEADIVNSQKGVTGKEHRFSIPINNENSYDLLAQIADMVEIATQTRQTYESPLFTKEYNGVQKRYEIYSENFSRHRFEISAEAVGKLKDLLAKSYDGIAPVAQLNKIDTLVQSLNQGILPSAEDRLAVFKPICSVLTAQISAAEQKRASENPKEDTKRVVVRPEVRLNTLLDRLANPNYSVDNGYSERARASAGVAPVVG